MRFRELGRCLNLLGRGDEAVQPLLEALKLKPRDPAPVVIDFVCFSYNRPEPVPLL